MKRALVMLLVLSVALGVFVAGCAQQPESAVPTGTPSETEAPTAGGGAPTEGAPQVAGVMIESYAFMPSTLTVKVDTTVKWTNFDKVKHIIVSEDGSFDSGELNTGDTFEHTFNTTGEYPYTSANYPTMIAKIVVEE